MFKQIEGNSFEETCTIEGNGCACINSRIQVKRLLILVFTEGGICAMCGEPYFTRKCKKNVSTSNL